jgi:hypothetical protein
MRDSHRKRVDQWKHYGGRAYYGESQVIVIGVSVSWFWSNDQCFMAVFFEVLQHPQDRVGDAVDVG